MILNPYQRTKLDSRSDDLFYAAPRFVTHVDDFFLARLTDLYRQYLKPQLRVLDLMSSWVSHLPPELSFAEVVGHGMNAAELARNPRLDRYFVQNLNEELALPLEDASFDAVLMAVSVQYLQYPEATFTEIARILNPQGVVIVSFSNRMFFEKAIQAWREGTEGDRLRLVQTYIDSIPSLKVVETQLPRRWPWLGFTDPFYAVVGQKQSA
ncbi:MULTISPECIES: methyltransferase domain-containing protein [unclassified Thermosynechococcus]|uniref:class I SAM-dependent methyltransferase n=1 Tax=unclassified Thermosynechococcus TaxID=2622553 RepID=UPI002671B721|nr:MULTISPECIES: methyltransferase domain-containing protein [unclassified Thermosynechococcus]MDR5639701.1 methyltransferase domain-containing protein [Thermosynechococcus sp. PP42]MDR7921632.1 methyltransferase domain-containing protein [Thermosynechococcus sp. HY213]WKT82195.1 methyltransferase domain-containing protein [Thermosynechococcus sp. PP45]WNC25812.1 methyltransferase domain-containing protein [Thermosynechococcus sp. PP551]WNC28392.1 methyltransferase domain-containing protein [T